MTIVSGAASALVSQTAAYPLAQATAGKRPTPTTIGTRTAFATDGVDDNLTSGAYTNSGYVSWFGVVQPITMVSDKGICSLGYHHTYQALSALGGRWGAYPNSPADSGATLVVGTPYVLAVVMRSSDMDLWTNGTKNTVGFTSPVYNVSAVSLGERMAASQWASTRHGYHVLFDHGSAVSLPRSVVVRICKALACRHRIAIARM